MHINWGVHLRAGVLGCRPKGGYLRGMHINRGGGSSPVGYSLGGFLQVGYLRHSADLAPRGKWPLKWERERERIALNVKLNCKT